MSITSLIYSPSSTEAQPANPRINELETKIIRYYSEIMTSITKNNISTTGLAYLNNLCEEIYILIRSCKNLDPKYRSPIESEVRSNQAKIIEILSQIVAREAQIEKLESYFLRFINSFVDNYDTLGGTTTQIRAEVRETSRNLVNSNAILQKWNTLTTCQLAELDIVITSKIKSIFITSPLKRTFTFKPRTIIEKFTPENILGLIERISDPKI